MTTSSDERVQPLVALRKRLLARLGVAQFADYRDGWEDGVDAALAALAQLDGLVSLSLDGRMHPADGMCRSIGCAEVPVYIVLAEATVSGRDEQVQS